MQIKQKQIHTNTLTIHHQCLPKSAICWVYLHVSYRWWGRCADATYMILTHMHTTQVLPSLSNFTTWNIYPVHCVCTHFFFYKVIECLHYWSSIKAHLHAKSICIENSYNFETKLQYTALCAFQSVFNRLSQKRMYWNKTEACWTTAIHKNSNMSIKICYTIWRNHLVSRTFWIEPASCSGL